MNQQAPESQKLLDGEGNNIDGGGTASADDEKLSKAHRTDSKASSFATSI